MKSFFRSLALVMLGVLLPAVSSHAQHRMESLGRGTVAVPTSAGVMVNWRITGPEYAKSATYNLYRGATKIASGLNVSNFADAASTGEGYSVAAVVGGVEQNRSAAVAPLANQFFKIPVRAINGSYAAYEINDASVGDLDGDGEYEIVIKRLSVDATPSATTYHYLEAYKMDGTFMWAINLGPNMINKVEVNFLVYDLDGDGKAEVATRTSDGFTDGAGNYVGDRDGDGKVSYRSTAVLNSSYYRIDGPDYISIFDGATGKEIAWNKYIDREPMSQWGTAGMNDGQLSHRATKCMWSVAYLDGVNPSFIISRGIYHRIKLEAWHFRNGALSKEWAYDSDPGGIASLFTGSGDHNFIVGDVDGDGRDEIMYGSMGVDEYGKGMYSTGFGHGDAQHLADINPDIKGLEHFSCLEGANGTTVPGLSLRNATTGAIQWKLDASGDIGRCMVADIDENHKGYEMWGSDGSGIYSSTGKLISTAQPTTAGGGGTYNFGIWWDGDVMRELLDRTVITKWNATNQSTDRVATLYNLASIAANNSTKSNPSLMADVLGDWREEAIFPSSDQTGLVVFTTPFSTNQRMYTLMHDPNYRTAISWQQNSYNQPPNLGFYFGVGMSTPPVPNITVVEPTAISLTAPADKASSHVGETITLAADAHASQGTASVTFYATEKATMTMIALGTDIDAPYAIKWTPTKEGTYYIVAKVTDGFGKTIASNIITYTVSSATTDVSDPAKTAFFGLRRVGDLLYYNTIGSNSTLRLYSLNGSQGSVQALSNSEGFVSLNRLAPSQGLFIASIEQESVVKFRMLLMR
jgi:rhamnogalacturonan endolyase